MIANYPFNKTIFAILSLVSIHASAQITNLIKDVEIDAINKPWRPLVTGELKRKVACIFDAIMVILAYTFAYLVSDWFFNMLFVLTFFAWGFTLLPVRKNAFTHVFWMGITRGFLPAYMIAQNVYIALLMFTWNFAFNPSKDYKDVYGDLRFGIKTIINQYGEEILKIWMYVFGFTFYFNLSIMVVSEILSYRSLILLFTSPIAYAIPNTLRERPAFSDNNLAYDLYWFGFTLNAVFLAISI